MLIQCLINLNHIFIPKAARTKLITAFDIMSCSAGGGSVADMAAVDEDVFNVTSVIYSEDLNENKVIQLMIDHIHGWEASNTISMSDFRSSQNIRRLVTNLLASNSESCDPKDAIGQNTMRNVTQMSSFVTLIASTLCFPKISSILGFDSFLGEEDSAQDLTALKSNLAKLLWTFLASNQLLLKFGSDACLDKVRSNIIVNLIGLQVMMKGCSCLEALHEVTLPLLRYFTENMLASKALCEESITAMSKAFQYAKKLASGNNKSNSATITKSCNYYAQLEEIFCEYFGWLRSNFNKLRLNSRNSDLIASINADLRKNLKDEEYSNPKDIVTIFNRKYKDFLSVLPIPVHPFQKSDIEQSKKDIQREWAYLNREKFKCSADNVSLLLSKIKFDINNFLMNTFLFDDLLSREDNSANNDEKKAEGSQTFNNFIGRSMLAFSDFKWKNDLLSVLCDYTILATSRSINGGDIFFILNDLYGGEGLSICPFPQETHADGNEKQPTSKGESPSSFSPSFDDYSTNIGINLNGIKVTMQERYNLFLKSDIEFNNSQRSPVQPFISFNCKLTTLFLLTNPKGTTPPTSPVKAKEPAINLATFSTSIQTKKDGEKAAYKLYTKLFIDAESVCRRAVSITPFIS